MTDYSVDATPDGRYALRILRAYRQGCDSKWTDNTSGAEPTNALLVEMSKLQGKRAKELDKAIAILEKNTVKLMKPPDRAFEKLDEALARLDAVTRG